MLVFYILTSKCVKTFSKYDPKNEGALFTYLLISFSSVQLLFHKALGR